jgi:hypothetical protein
VALRPELAPAEAEAVVHAALGAVNSVALSDSGLPAGNLETILGTGARAVLGRA